MMYSNRIPREDHKPLIKVAEDVRIVVPFMTRIIGRSVHGKLDVLPKSIFNGIAAPLLHLLHNLLSFFTPSYTRNVRIVSRVTQGPRSRTKATFQLFTF